MPLENEEDFFDLVSMRRIAFPRGHVHNAQRKSANGNDGIIRLPAGIPDETMLRPSVTIDQGIGEGFPVRLTVLEIGDLPVCDILNAHTLEFRQTRMARDMFRHECALSG